MITLKRPDGNLPEDFHLSRRGVAAAIFAGYAVAALSADAEPIHTDEAGLVTETVQLATADGAHIRGYIARPKASGRFPAVIVVNEIFGLHAYILDVCRRFAKLGYVAIAPGFFDRAGDPAPLSMAQMDAIRKIVATADDQQVMSDVGVDAEVPGSPALRRAPQDRHHRLLLGRQGGLERLRDLSRLQGRRRLVRPDGADRRRAGGSRPSAPLAGRSRGRAEVSGARPLRRQGRAQPVRAGDARRR